MLIDIDQLPKTLGCNIIAIEMRWPETFPSNSLRSKKAGYSDSDLVLLQNYVNNRDILSFKKFTLTYTQHTVLRKF